MYERILVPTDGSPGVGDAVAAALDLAELSGGTVHGLSVVDTRDDSTLPEAKWLTLESELESQGEQAVETVAESATEREVPLETAIVRGVPHEEILEYADEQDVDVV
jgi:nucleotide-binding universal stress UspA family protein